MDYKKIYEDLVLRANKDNRVKYKGVYYESHHILPKCLGGDNSKENKVLLTAKEHFVCHKLLVEIYPDSKGLKHALWNMVNGRYFNEIKRNYIISSREYRIAKELHIEILHDRKGEKHPLWGKKGVECKNTGKIRSQETRNKISNTRKERGYCGENHSRFKKKHSVESIEKMRKAHKGEVPWNKGLIMPEEIRQHNREGQRNRPKLTCPHCGATMDANNAKHYHFDNCKFKLRISFFEAQTKDSLN